MDHDQIERLLESHAGLKLLRAQNAPLILSFLQATFIKRNRRSIPANELAAALDDSLSHLRETQTSFTYTNSVKGYLDDWSNGPAAYLRKYYPAQRDEPEFDLTPAVERALEWLASLDARQFVGTESRLLSLFQMLGELTRGTQSDPRIREQELLERRDALDRELDRLRAGVIETLDDTRVKERYFQLEDTARWLLADFRQIEENFRRLDQQTREKITTSDLRRGALLSEIFGEQDHIRDTDQGRSFAAFWELLMSPQRQDEFATMLDAVHALETVQALAPSGFLQSIPYALLAAGEKVQLTASLLVEQLRKFLDDQTQLENRRLLELIRGIEKAAIAVKSEPPKGAFAELDDTRPALDLPLCRALFTPPRNPVIADGALAAGVADDISLDALLTQEHVDETRLREQIDEALRGLGQVSLAALAERFPIRQGVAEVVAYLKLAMRSEQALIDDDVIDMLTLPSRHGGAEPARTLRVPRVIFLREISS